MMSIFFPVAPWFGLLLNGNPARAYYVGLTIIWFYGGWALYRLDRRGWWIVFIAMVASLASSFVTFSHHDISEFYAQMGYSAQQTELVRQSGFGNRMMLWSVIGMVPFLGYMLYVRKFLRGGKVGNP